MDKAEGLDTGCLVQNVPLRPRARERTRQGRAGRYQARTVLQVQENQLTRFESGRKKFNAKLSASRKEDLQQIGQEGKRVTQRNNKHNHKTNRYELRPR